MPYMPIVPIPVKIGIAVGVIVALGCLAIRCPRLQWECLAAGGALAFWAGAQAGKLREWNKHRLPPGE
jgi:hypothetical protein